MKTNLSSQITLNRVSPRYYRPENAFERSVLTRLEKIPTDIYESAEEGANHVAYEIAQLIRDKQKAGRFCVLALPGGNSPRNVYSALIRIHKEEGLSFRNVIIFNLYEYYPLTSDAINSNLNALKEMFLDHVDVDKQNIFSPDGTIPKDTIFEYCRLYEQRIESFGGLDAVLLGIGRVGNIGFNEPGSRLNSTTRLILLDNDSRNEASKMFGSIESTPISSITMGVSTILAAKKIYLMAWGEDKAKMVKECVEGAVTDTIPASFLQTHNNAHVVIDLSAAGNLTRIHRPWLVTSCEWNDKLIRSAIVWLCQLTGKPILKLTNKDYNENGLSELLALFGSAYNVNIKIFNDLQHTITGWPGGKPNADDTYRPERAKPYPKRIVVFSPHPDDDVISMGGTIRRLVEQKHDVHVAYETSGNIAVGDEEVIRFLHFINGFNQIFNNSEDKVVVDKYAEIRKFLKEKKDGELIPVTVLQAGPCEVTQVKTVENDGYSAVQVGFQDMREKLSTKPMKGHFEKAGVSVKRFVREFKLDDAENYELGQKITVDVFEAGDKVDATAISKGKGFQGAIKRHGQHTGPKTHGSKYHRHAGSNGMASDPSKVMKGKKMPGQMGHVQITIQNLEVVKIDAENNVILVKGSVPGPKKSLVTLKAAVKA